MLTKTAEVQTKQYWHKLRNDEIQKLRSAGKTWGYIVENYLQPDWCNYPEALGGQMGCWSLIDSDIRQKISMEYCKNCDCFVANQEALSKQ